MYVRRGPLPSGLSAICTRPCCYCFKRRNARMHTFLFLKQCTLCLLNNQSVIPHAQRMLCRPRDEPSASRRVECPFLIRVALLTIEEAHLFSVVRIQTVVTDLAVRGHGARPGLNRLDQTGCRTPRELEVSVGHRCTANYLCWVYGCHRIKAVSEIARYPERPLFTAVFSTENPQLVRVVLIARHKLCSRACLRSWTRRCRGGRRPGLWP
mmetsp:Transcript_4031/g.10148  ORF Transcript_4031/g.10148 Transcript_4031/m.10148 type:complete len:210 (+) Transcript_4031:660-1289(+)